MKTSLETAPALWTLIPGTLDTWKFLKGQEAGEQVSEICRCVGQCILGLQVRLVSAPPRQRGQPAGLGRDWIHRGLARQAGLGGDGFSRRRKTTQSTVRIVISWSCRTAVTITCPVTLGEPLLSVNGGFALAPPRKSGDICSRWVELGQVPLWHILAACWLEGATSAA